MTKNAVNEKTTWEVLAKFESPICDLANFAELAEGYISHTLTAMKSLELITGREASAAGFALLEMVDRAHTLRDDFHRAMSEAHK